MQSIQVIRCEKSLDWISAKKNRLCYRCLGLNHLGNSCHQKGKCNINEWEETNFTNLSLIEFQIFGLICSFLSNRQFWVVLVRKSSQEYPVNAEFLKGPFLVLQFFLLYINDLPDLSVILLSMLMIILSILTVIRNLICGNNLNWLLN